MIDAGITILLPSSSLTLFRLGGGGGGGGGGGKCPRRFQLSSCKSSSFIAKQINSRLKHKRLMTKYHVLFMAADLRVTCFGRVTRDL